MERLGRVAALNVVLKKDDGSASVADLVKSLDDVGMIGRFDE